MGASLLSDPDGGVNGGSCGSGLSSDFEFSLDSISGDTIKLTGRFNKCEAYLVKATQQEQADYVSLQRNRDFDHIRLHHLLERAYSRRSKQYDIIINARSCYHYSYG